MTEERAPRRNLGLVHATGIVVGAIIGVGIFLTPAKVAAVAHSPAGALAMWVGGGLIALCGALSLAEVGARYPRSGGQLLALKEALGPLPAFLYGWCLLIAIQTGVLVLITQFAAQNLAILLGRSWSEVEVAAVGTAMLASLAVANLAGVRQGAAIQTSTSLAKLLILFGLAALGVAVAAGWIAPARAQPLELPAGKAGSDLPWIAGLAAVLFSYGGFHQLTWVGGEVREPGRTVPRAIALGILLVIVSYLAANLAYLALLPFDELVSSPSLAADAVGSVFPGWGARATAAALCVSAYGIANASLLTAPRVYYALAREGLFLPGFQRIHPGSGVPRAAILLQFVLALLLLWLLPKMDQLVTGVVFVDWTFHALTCIGLVRLRARATDAAPGYRCPGVPWVPLAFVAGTAAALGATFLDRDVRQASLLGLAVFAAGLPVYWALRTVAKSAQGR